MAELNPVSLGAAAQRTTIKVDVQLTGLSGGALGTEKVRAYLLPPPQGSSKEVFAFTELKNNGVLTFARGATKATLEIITTPARLVADKEYLLYVGIEPYQSSLGMDRNVLRLVIKLAGSTTGGTTGGTTGTDVQVVTQSN